MHKVSQQSTLFGVLVLICFEFPAFHGLAQGQSFTKITTGEIVNDGGESWGSSWGDYDNDGDLDIFVANDGEENNFLYENNGDGTFTKITVEDVVNNGGSSRSSSWGDYNNDGYLDLYVVNITGKNFLYANDGVTFTRITSAEIAKDNTNSGSCSWGDYDNDGELDLFCSSPSSNNFLYSNNGDGTFRRITEGDIVNNDGSSQGCSWADFDNDGDLDLFVANFNNQNNFLYSNNGDGTFTKIASGDIVNDGGNSLGGSWGDYDNDGDLDLFVANWFNNFLYSNNGDGTFTKITSGPIVSDGGASDAGSWADYDNDGDLDLFVAKSQNQDNLLYSNNGDGTFTKVLEGIIVSDDGYSRSGIWGDYDNDGDLDLFIANETGNNFLYSNDGTANHWINVKCVGTMSNTSGIGVKVSTKATVNGAAVWQIREVSGQTGARSQSSLNVHFGLGNATAVDSMIIEWPSGLVQRFSDIAVDQFLTISETEIPPKSPSNLRATAEDQEVTLSWDANTDLDFLRLRRDFSKSDDCG